MDAFPTKTPPLDARDPHAALMARVASARDRSAFRELFGWYAPRVKGFLMRLGSDAAAAEELTQEVMVAVWTKAGAYDPSQASVSTWIFRIARNRRIDLFRREQVAARLDPDDPYLRPEPTEAPDEAVLAVDREARIREALRSLPPEQGELVRRHVYEDLTHAEIAESTGLPLGTVKSRLRLAFAKLRGGLEPDL